jgi:chromosome segregation ATPase
MTRTQQMLALIGLFLVGLWGCQSNSAADRAREMEERIAKLEADLKAGVTSREALKTRVTALEEQVRAETERAKLIELERDALTLKLQRKIAEKETVVSNYDDLVKKLEGILGQAKVVQGQQADDAEAKVRGTVTSYPKK